MTRRLACFLLCLFFCTFGALAQPADWRVLSKAALQLDRDGQSEQAIMLARKAIEAAESGDDQLAVGVTRSTLGFLQMKGGDYHTALEQFTLAQGYYEADSRLGPEHEMTAKIYKNRGLCLHQLGEHKEAEKSLRKALHNYELLDPSHGHPFTLDIVQAIANSLFKQARLEEAKLLYSEVLEKVDDNTQMARTAKEGLADLLASSGDFEGARELLEPVVEHYKLSNSPADFPRLAGALGKLGHASRAGGDFATAESLYKRALSISEKTSATHPRLATAVNNLGLLYAEIGDLERAQAMYERALAIHRELLGKSHPLTAVSLSNLALLLSRRGNQERAEELLKQALVIDEKVLGADHPQTARALSNLGTLYLSTERPELAEPLFQSAVRILRLHGSTGEATALNNLGSALHRLDRYREAQESFQQSLELTSGGAQEAARNNLAYLSIDRKKRKQALEHARQASQAQLARLKSIFSFTSERQRLAFKRELVPYGLFATLESPDDLFLTALRFKGAVLDSIVEDQRFAQTSEDPEMRALLGEMQRGKRELLALELLPTGDRARDKLPTLRKAIEDGEATLARRLSGLKRGRSIFRINPKQVQQALPPKTVLIEFLYHGYYLGDHQSEKRYGALVVTPKGKPRWVPLGEADEIKGLVTDYRDQIQGKRTATRAVRLTVQRKSASTEPTSLKALYDKVWAPIERVLPKGTETVVLSPDGELNFVSFAALLNSKDRFLGEEYNVLYVSSGRDLVASTSESDVAEDVGLFGAPDYGLGSGQKGSIHLVPLPGTAQECRSLENLLKTKGTKAGLHLDKEATEKLVSGTAGSRILHIATHGFFLGEDFGPQGPMVRSGLALAGAQTTLDDWARGEAPDPSNDGVLTAQEVGALNLESTNLVVLSACDTGLGASENGEGVLGLRRGFVQSGARHLLFTLWPIDDEQTARFMVDFYGAVSDSDPRTGINTTQREWLTRLREKEGPINAARLAGPFVMSFQGRL